MDPIKPKLSLGQHFLKDGNIIRKIANTIPAGQNDLVLEIGPGTGMLSRELLKRFKRVKAVEIDQRVVHYLESDLPDLDVVHADILKADLDDLIPDDSSAVHIVGNLPYNITSQILFKILAFRDRLSSAVLMMQKEVAARLVAVPSTKDYGILSVQVQLMSRPEIKFDVSNNAFFPRPKVTSSVVLLHFDRPPLNCSDENLKKVVRTAFQQRRKKLSNSLKSIQPLPEAPLFDYSKRAEAWEPEIYEKLAVCLEQDGILS